jgi:hypothetical protein
MECLACDASRLHQLRRHINNRPHPSHIANLCAVSAVENRPLRSKTMRIVMLSESRD